MKSKIDKYLECRGMTYGTGFESEKEIRKFIKDNKIEDEFGDLECGGLVFKKAKSGRRYIQFTPGRCYID